MRWFKQSIWLKVQIPQTAAVGSIYHIVLENTTWDFFSSWPPVDFMHVTSSLLFTSGLLEYRILRVAIESSLLKYCSLSGEEGRIWTVFIPYKTVRGWFHSKKYRLRSVFTVESEVGHEVPPPAKCWQLIAVGRKRGSFLSPRKKECTQPLKSIKRQWKGHIYKTIFYYNWA